MKNPKEYAKAMDMLHFTDEQKRCIVNNLRDIVVEARHEEVVVSMNKENK